MSEQFKKNHQVKMPSRGLISRRYLLEDILILGRTCTLKSYVYTTCCFLNVLLEFTRIFSHRSSSDQVPRFLVVVGGREKGFLKESQIVLPTLTI